MRVGSVKIMASVLVSFVVGIAIFGQSTDTQSFHQLMDDHWAQTVKEQVYYRMDSDAWRPHGKLAEVTPQARERRAKFNHHVLDQLAKIDIAKLDQADQINYRVFKFERETEKEGNQYFDHLFPINKLFGFHTYFADAPASMSFRSYSDYEEYLISLNDFPRFNREHIELLKQAIELGYTHYGPSMEGYEITIKSHIVEKAEDSALYIPFKSFPNSISTSQQDELKARGIKVINEKIIPAFRELHEFFMQSYMPNCRTSVGISSLKGGEAYYNFLIYFYTTVRLSAREIHDTGLAEVARIRGEMDLIIKQLNFDGDFAAFLDHLRNDPKSYAQNEQDLLEKVSFICKRMDGLLPTLFGLLPRNTYSIKPTPFRGAFYMAATSDGTTSGTYFIGTNLKSQPVYTLEALSLHEAVPGHHLQTALAMELDMPEFRKTLYHAAFGEGWGLYAERLGKEVGFYQEPTNDFGRLTYEMWRSCRLVVDTGMHAFGWSRQQAIDYLMENTALTQDEVTAEIDRYITWPGQALAYKIGELRIRALRAKAEAALGQDFDLRDFHDVVIGSGSLPIAVLEDLINDWIKSQR